MQPGNIQVIMFMAIRDLDSGDDEAGLHMMNTFSPQLITS